MSIEEKVKEYMLKVKNPYELEIKGMMVKIEYSENNKKFSQCIVNILKQRRLNI